METNAFHSVFKHLTGNEPFPWQADLYHLWFAQGKIPDSCNLPTGLGKTSVIAVWLIALANGAKVPRRLAYVVNRRTVVDQTTVEVEKYRNQLKPAGLWTKLASLSGTPTSEEDPPLALSTLRGQFADNREWSVDPSRPAVICGTVDMIGSRLLFSGYGIGVKAKPLHAGFLGQDVLLVHDEAHLEPAFQELLLSIEKEQERCKEFGTFKVMELTATSRGEKQPFELSDSDREHPIVLERIASKKALDLHENKDPKKLAEELVERAVQHKDSGKPILIFAREVTTVLKIQEQLEKQKQNVLTLTGTKRGRERDRLVEDEHFQRFLPTPSEGTQTVYLICTSAGEVGVNISAHHLVCDLSTFESMAQRFGRVNRFGKEHDTRIDVIYPNEFDTDDEYEARLSKTLALLEELNNNASPAAIGKLDPIRRQAAFAPTPTILPATDILFDAWALTSIKGKLPGRPPVEPYLHGIAGWQPPETHVAWREEVGLIVKELLDTYDPAELLDAYPLKPHEILRDTTKRVLETLKKFKDKDELPVWIQAEDGSVQVKKLAEVQELDVDDLRYTTLILPPDMGGLNEQGMLDEKGVGSKTLDVADELFDVRDPTQRQRVRVWSHADDYDQLTKDMRRVVSIVIPGSEDDEDAEEKSWDWFVRRSEGESSNPEPVLWQTHVDGVEWHAKAIVSRLPLSEELKQVVRIAAKFHDHGKRRKIFQRVLGNHSYRGDGTDTDQNTLAKSGKKSKSRLEEKYRHEFGSLLDLTKQFRTELSRLHPDHQDLALHLIATHHGRARPHFPADEVFDPNYPDSDATAMAMTVPRRFAKLQRKYGRWGLAYLESLLRAADWAASNNPSKHLEGSQ